MSTGCWLAWPSTAIPKLQRGQTVMSVTNEEISWVVSSLDLGNAVSPLPMCYLADVLGRKFVIIVSGVMFFVASVMTFFAATPAVLYVARFLAGVGKGITFAVVPMYLGEISSVPIRGALSFSFSVFLWLGSLFDYATGPFVSFKILAVLTGIVPMIFFTTFMFCPESPYFYLMKRHEKSARKALSWLRNTSPSKLKQHHNTTELELKDMAITVDENLKNKGRFYDVFLIPGNRYALCIVIVLALFQRLSGISPLLSYSSITLPPNDRFGPDEGVILFGCFLALICLSAILLVDRLGRRPLLIISGIGCCVVNGTSAIFYYLYKETDLDMNSFLWVPYVCLMGYALFFGIGLSNIPLTLLGELFPTDVKSFAAALTSIAFALASFIVNKLYITIESSIGLYANYAFYSLIGLVSAIFTFFTVFETKGRTFSEIQRKLNKKDSKKTFETKF